MTPPVPYKLLVTDLDGTLLDGSGQVHASDAQAIARLLERGVAVSIATGRMYSGTRFVCQQLRLGGPVACIDGSHIVDAETDRDLALTTLDLGAAAALLDALHGFESATFVFAEDHIHYDDVGERFLPFMNVWSKQSRRVTRVTREERWSQDAVMAALVSVGSEAEIRAAAQHAGAHEQLMCVHFPVKHPIFSGMWGMLVRAQGPTKGTALARIADHHGVSLEETLAVGDWHNDVPMFQRAGRSFAMRQAPDTVKHVASDLLEADSGSGGGIAEAARRAGLL